VRLFVLDIIGEQLQDLKKIRKETFSKKTVEQVLKDLRFRSKNIENISHKATRTILLLKPEISLSAEKTYEDLSLILADLKQNIHSYYKKETLLNKLDSMISSMTKLNIMLRKSINSPSPIIKRIMELTENSGLNTAFKKIPNAKLKKRRDYMQTKITSFDEVNE
jgi:hypothetical protein